MTTASVALIDTNNPNFWIRTNSTGTSSASKKLHDLFNKNIEDLRKSVIWNRKGDVFSSLNKVYQSCSMANWDGYGALPISAISYGDAASFLNALPTQLPVPEITPEIDGTIGLDWENGNFNTFTVILSGKGSIVYAGILGKGNTSHGTEIFDDSIPENIISIIKRIYS